MYNIKLSSPALRGDWKRFLESNPDVESAIEWLDNNVPDDALFASKREKLWQVAIDYEPGDIYEGCELKKWANDNNYYNDIEDFGRQTIVDYVRKNFYLREVFTTDDLEAWAESKYIEREEVVKLLDGLERQITESIREMS
jgi:hypothetical protein